MRKCRKAGKSFLQHERTVDKMDGKKYIEMESYMSTQELIRELQTPGTEFSPVPFWFFNDAF